MIKSSATGIWKLKTARLPCVVSGSMHCWVHNVKHYYDLMRDACVMWKLVDAARSIFRYCKVC